MSVASGGSNIRERVAHFFVSVCGSKIRWRVAQKFIDIHTFIIRLHILKTDDFPIQYVAHVELRRTILVNSRQILIAKPVSSCYFEHTQNERRRVFVEKGSWPLPHKN